jgi:hypothetical protein
MPPAKRPPKKYRVMWTDLGSEGHFLDVDAASVEEAAWKVAVDLEAGAFHGIICVPAAEGEPRG